MNVKNKYKYCFNDNYSVKNLHSYVFVLMQQCPIFLKDKDNAVFSLNFQESI